ncbi:hypothetical protein GCK32_002431 [Trichostrongylus colubriformis]|uniref:Uncharacterized protein n=1 Tax=Trichostrongylus colubriformis TaxID=6319 RepID=A0AAN8EWF0_TRICO
MFLYSCICSTGMEYTFEGSSASSHPLQDSIGSYYCANNADLCVQDVFGRQWRPAHADNLITIMPVAKCVRADVFEDVPRELELGQERTINMASGRCERGQSRNLPSKLLSGQQCAVFLLMMASRPSVTADLVSSTERLRYSDMVANSTFISFDRHVYLPIRGFSCDSCAESYCRSQ